ncbi:MAG: hypothetical protein BWY10_02578 [Chloroflexi bacterium ADurb.Bin180]|nr:MAG: hypothetical protein BWY10_02578 [Chloroflexi bacterium ADurb.Bin180]
MRRAERARQALFCITEHCQAGMIKGRQLVGLCILLYQSLDASQPVAHGHDLCQRQRGIV